MLSELFPPSRCDFSYQTKRFFWNLPSLVMSNTSCVYQVPHMGSLTCVHSICLPHIHMCMCLYLCMCVCLTVSREGWTSSSFGWNSAETSAYVAEFIWVNNRVWNACFPHWAEHFLMQYVNTCVTTRYRRKYCGAAELRAIGLAYADEDETGGHLFCEDYDYDLTNRSK